MHGYDGAKKSSQEGMGLKDERDAICSASSIWMETPTCYLTGWGLIGNSQLARVGRTRKGKKENGEGGRAG